MFDARAVQGRWRRLRTWADAVLIAILLAIPWIHIQGEPLVLLDIPARKFHVFGLVIFPQELYFLWLILAGLALSLFLFTALFGRLWCGWACPQTVFTDVFAMIVRRIEGWKGTRRPARVAAWRSALLHAVLALLCVAIGFHLVGYFRSPYDMLASLAGGEVSRASFGFLAVASALAYLDFVWIRQTFCKFLCPYARFQGVLFDRNTLVIGYDARRGEPRGKKGRASGDCVDCGLCVAVCPTGIDIRAGLQLECIACTQCIDACNGVMERLQRPRNLIGYAPLEALEGGGATCVLRPRVVAYATLLVAACVAFGGLLARRLPMDLQVEHNRSALSSRLPDGRLGNAFTLHIENRDRRAHEFRVRVEDGAGRLELIAGRNPIEIAATSAIETRVFVVEPLARREEGEEQEEEERDERRARPIRFVLERADDASRRIVRATHFLALEVDSDD